MPTYQYRCTACGEDLEAVQRFSDDPLTTCPACEGALRKVFTPVGVVFKGSGFYKNDSRAKSATTAGAPGSKDSSAPSAGSGSGGDSGSGGTPSGSSGSGESTGSSSGSGSSGSGSSGSGSSGSGSSGSGSSGSGSSSSGSSSSSTGSGSKVA